MLSQLAYFFGGIAVLVLGAELLVRGASRLAAAAGVSSLVIGLTVVAFGTSAPELAVSLNAATGGEPDLAIGNAVGSNIFNVLCILGLSALLKPLVVHRQLIRIDVPVMIGVCALFWALSLDGSLSRAEGLIFILLLGGYVALSVILGRKESQQNGTPKPESGAAAPPPMKRGAWIFDLLSIAVGLGFLVLGARWIVDSATAMAQAMGVSDLIIALTVVAAGTSLPEVATSVMATLRGQRDIAVGNAIGSNIFNVLCIMGFSAALATEGINVAAPALHFDIPVMVAVCVACYPIFFTGHTIARWEGALFLAYYAAYTIYLILKSMEHDGLQAYSRVMIGYVVPLTLITLAVCFYRGWKDARRGAPTP
ncbi:MAG: sodium:calcium antiporter [Planctomycetota bacterium]